MDKEQAEKMLTAAEKRELEGAREVRFEVYGLEHYSRLWDSIDARMGPNNELAGHFVEEYKQRAYERPRDHEESRRVDMMRASFYLPRTGMPREVTTALLFSGRR